MGSLAVTCSCGRKYTEYEFKALPPPKTGKGGILTVGIDAYLVRNCPCKSTLHMPIDVNGNYYRKG